MPKQLYEEAIADVKRVKQVAEDDAKRAILEAVTPRIREFIDQAILGNPDEDGDDVLPPGADAPAAAGGPPLGDGESSAAAGMAPAKAGLATDILSADPKARVPVTGAGPVVAVSPPDSQGKVTLDIDALCSTEPAGSPVPPPMFGSPGGPEGPGGEVAPTSGGGAGGAPAPLADDTEYEISLESIEALQPIAAGSKKPVMTKKEVRAQIAEINKKVSLFQKTSKAVRATQAFNKQIAQMICRVEDMYDYVQEQLAESAEKSSYESILEASFKALTIFQEPTPMSQKTKQSRINEADVTLKLTGLPDDIELEDVGVDLVTDEEDDMGGEQGDMDDMGMGGDQGGDQLDMGGQGDQQMETRRLSDETIVEIDEKMLRREIARMKNIREEHSATGGSETKAQSWGNGADHFDSFGGGKDEGEFDDQEIVDKSPSPGALPLGEADGEDLDEQDDLDEADEQDDDDLDEGDMQSMDELQLKRKEDEFGAKAANDHSVQAEALKVRIKEATKRLNFEKQLQEKAKARGTALKKAARTASSKKDAKRFNECKKEYKVVASRFTESVERAKKMSQFVASATKKLQESRSNSGTARSAENGAENASLRKKLAETNLFNAKLLYTNKLLQNEQLTARQKAQVIKQLDSAKTSREAKLVYESLAGALAGTTSKTVNEGADRKVLGSGSRATRPASTTQSLNEGYEAERWAQLAGITKNR